MTELLDAHLHFWDPDARHHEWLAAHPPLRRRFGPDDLSPGHHELVGALFVQADCREDEALDEVRWVRQLAADHPVICGVVAYAPLQRGRAAVRHLEALAAQPLVVGVRRLLQGLPPEAITERAFICGVRLLPEWGLTFDLCATHEQLPAVAELVRACPRTTFVLDHLGKPPVASGEIRGWRKNINRIASHPNVACKLSGLSTEAADGFRPAEVRPYLEHGLEAFGPQRCMIASDWPVLTLRTTMQQWFDAVLDVIGEVSPADRQAVLGDTARATYGLPSPLRASKGGDHARSVVCR